MTHLDQYARYLVNAGRPLKLSEFDEDWAPIGENVRAYLKANGLAVEHDGLIRPTPPSNTRAAFDAMEGDQRADYEDYLRRCGGVPISKVKP